jgi:hypothetical protein
MKSLVVSLAFKLTKQRESSQKRARNESFMTVFLKINKMKMESGGVFSYLGEIGYHFGYHF